MLYSILLIFFTSTFLFANDKQAEIPDYNEIHQPYWNWACLDELNQKLVDQCGQESLIASQHKLDELLKHIDNSYSKYQPKKAHKLKESQLYWNKITEINCSIETDESKEGSGFYSILNACLEMKTNERISYLHWIVNNP